MDPNHLSVHHKIEAAFTSVLAFVGTAGLQGILSDLFGTADLPSIGYHWEQVRGLNSKFNVFLVNQTS